MLSTIIIGKTYKMKIIYFVEKMQDQVKHT